MFTANILSCHVSREKQLLAFRAMFIKDTKREGPPSHVFSSVWWLKNTTQMDTVSEILTGEKHTKIKLKNQMQWIVPFYLVPLSAHRVCAARLRHRTQSLNLFDEFHPLCLFIRQIALLWQLLHLHTVIETPPPQNLKSPLRLAKGNEFKR